MAAPERSDVVPRNYQVELLEKAIEKNVILCLGTGTGKTYISVMLLRELLYQTRPSLHDGGKRSVFLAPTIPLAKQQSKYLRKFLDAKVGVYIGAEVDLWTGDVWANEFAHHNVLVMTPQVFLNILNFNYVQLSSVNVLVLDECHAATGKSPYVQIMQNHYRDLEDCKRPKILGLTASVLNRKIKPASVQKEVRELCSRLNSNLTTSLDAISYGTKPTETIVTYNAMPPIQISIPESPGDVNGTHAPGQNPLATQVRRLLQDVGPFGALKSMEHRIHITQHLIDTALAEPYVIAKYNVVLNDLRVIEDRIKEWSRNVRSGLQANQYPVVIPPDLRNVLVEPDQYSFPPKFHRLLEMFRTFERRNITLCCVVFAQERYTVFALWCVLTMLSRRCPHRYGYIRPGFIMGQGSLSQFGDAQSKIMNFVDERQTEDSDEDVLDDFREGRVNVLIATSVIEEGVDIPQCNLIVRFNEPMNLRSYVQSRGRARARPSIYAIMCSIDSVGETHANMRSFKDSELNVLKVCLQDDVDIDSADVEQALQDDPDLPTFFAFPEKPLESAIITAQSARTTLQWYCDTLSADRFKVLRPIFQYSVVMNDAGVGSQRCNIELPRESKLHNEKIYGEPLENKIKAKISASLKACKRLHEVGELTDNLVPKKRPRMDMYEWTDAEVSGEVRALFKGNTVTQKSTITCGRGRADQLRTRPIPCLPAFAELFVFRITLDEPFCDEHFHGKVFNVGEEPLCFGILTFAEGDAKCIPDFPLFTKAGREMVHVEQIHNVPITEAQWNVCSQFHHYMVTRVLRIPDVECDPLHAPAIVPISGDSLDYDLMDKLECSTSFPLNMDSVVTTLDNSDDEETERSYFVGKLFEENGVPHVSFMSIPKNLDFVRSRYTDKTKYRDDTSDQIKRRYAKVRDLCSVELLTASQWSKGLTVASCFYRLNRLLIAEEIRMKVVQAGIGTTHQDPSTLKYDRYSNNSHLLRSQQSVILEGINFITDVPIDSPGPSAADIYTALSPRSTNDIVDSERYEVIGDSFLKLAVTLSLFGRFDSEDEGYLTQQRCRLVSNIHLITLAVPHMVQDAVESVQFGARTNFLPPGCRAADSCRQALTVQKYKSKICADSIEALIGVYLEKAGANGALDFLNFLGLRLNCRSVGPFVSRFVLRQPTELNPQYPTRYGHELNEVQRLLGYQFSEPLLLLEAITHQSYRYNRLTRSYERLEFLGDAVIDYLVSRYLYCNCPQLSPGELTDARSALVCNNTFARAVANHQLYKHLLHQSPVLHKLTETYLLALQKGLLDETLICEDDTDDVGCIDVPKPLGDLLESLMGAVFLDSAMNFDRVWTVFRTLMTDDLLRTYLVTIPRNPITILMERFPREIVYSELQILDDKRVRLEMNIGSEHFVVIARNKKVARVALAKKALRHFDRARQRGEDALGPMERIARELQL